MKPIKRKDGRYQLSVQTNNKRKFFYGDTPKECMRSYEAFNGIAGSRPVALKTAFDDWMANYVSTKSKSTYSQYKALSHYILDIIGNIRTERVLPLNCQDVLNHAAERDLSAKTLMHIRGIMRSFFEHERKIRKTIKVNPCNDITTPKGRRTRDRRAATPEELEMIWQRLSESHYYLCFQFLLITGLRPSEACGIKLSNIKGDYLTIDEARTRYDVSSGKTRNAVRTISISLAMRIIINEQKRIIVKNKWKSVYLFPTSDGYASTSGNLTHAWTRAMSGSGIGLTLYELRHTFVSLMLDKMPLKELQMIIGHSSAMDTSTTYAHLFKNKQNASEIIDKEVSIYLPKTAKSV